MSISKLDPSRRATRGFTLIKLLIVIAIIAILAVILFPVFGRARDNARRTTCQSNLKQLGLGFAQYVQDHDERLPVAQYDPGTGDVTWDKVIEPYLGFKVSLSNGSPILLQCPSDTLARRGGNCLTAPNQSVRTYNMVGTSANLASMSGGRPMSSIPQTSQTLLLVEAPNIYNRAENFWASVTNPNDQMRSYVNANCGGVVYKEDNPIHFDGWNYLFIDGHVKWLKPEQTINRLGGGTMSAPRGMWTVSETD